MTLTSSMAVPELYHKQPLHLISCKMYHEL